MRRSALDIFPQALLPWAYPSACGIKRQDRWKSSNQQSWRLLPIPMEIALMPFISKAPLHSNAPHLELKAVQPRDTGPGDPAPPVENPIEGTPNPNLLNPFVTFIPPPLPETPGAPVSPAATK